MEDIKKELGHLSCMVNSTYINDEDLEEITNQIKLLNKLIDEKLTETPINNESSYMFFSDRYKMIKYARERGISEEREWWFTIGCESETIVGSLRDYYDLMGIERPLV